MQQNNRKLSNSPIFRADAVRRYMQSRQESVLPRLVSPRAFILCWAVVGLLMAITGFAWLAKVPVYATGTAIVVQPRQLSHHYDGEGPLLVMFLPPESFPRTHVGQRAFIRLDPASPPLERAIVALEPEVLSPQEARHRFRLDAGTGQVVRGPVAVAVARLGLLPGGLSSAKYGGGIYTVEVEIGSQRGLSLFPLVGPFFGD